MLRWFEKARKAPSVKGNPKADLTRDSDPKTDRNSEIQGSYTDHHEDSLKIRQQLSPMHGEELEAFHYCLKKLDEDHPDLSFADTVQEGLSVGMFEVGNEGELRVSREWGAQ